MNCTACPMLQFASCNKLVEPSGPAGAELLFVGEAPGYWEDRLGWPFMGPSGKEFDNYLQRVGILRSEVRVDNLLRGRPPGDRDPKPEEIEACGQHLDDYILSHPPKFVGALGAFATRWFLGQDASMELLHGIPQLHPVYLMNLIIVPMYHPAFGLHNTTNMTAIQQDFRAFKGTVDGKLKVGGVEDEFKGREEYVRD